MILRRVVYVVCLGCDVVRQDERRSPLSRVLCMLVAGIVFKHISLFVRFFIMKSMWGIIDVNSEFI
jgi:hypothetical protein